MVTINPLISTEAMPLKKLRAEQRLLRRSMYGMTDMIRVDLDGENLVYTLNTSGQTFNTAKEAFDAAGKTGMTTFARLTGDIETSSYNMRGLAGLEERLKSITEQLNVDTGLASRLGVNDPNLIRFEVGSFKTDLGNKTTIKSIVEQLDGRGIMVPDDSAFNLLRVFEGDREMTVGEISRLFSATSEGAGGILSTSELMDKLEGGAQKVASMYSKSGKRVRGAIGLRDISLSGKDLSNILEQVSGTSRLDERSVRVFKISDDLTEIAKNYLSVISTDEYRRISDPVSAMRYAEHEVMDFAKFRRTAETADDIQRRAYYSRSGTMEQVISALKGMNILNEDGTVARANAFIEGADGALSSKETEQLIAKFESGADGTGVMNAKTFNAMRSQIKSELETLTQLLPVSANKEAITMRIGELTSQLDKMEGDLFETITGRIFMNVERGGQSVPMMAKLVTGQAEFAEPLSTFSMLIPDVAFKRETSIMGRVDSLNLVLQGEPSPRVYADPLAPAFHYNVLSDPSVLRANQLRQNRIIADLNLAIETGEIKGNLRRQIYQSAEANLDLISETGRNSAERNRMFMRQLKEAIESGVDVRTMPQLLNYLKKNAAADLFKEKTGVGYLPALEDSFRLALDTEASYFRGKKDKAARLGEGLTDITIRGRSDTIKALTFQVQGHKMLFAGDATSIFKHSLGGFDLDDKGIVMPRIFEDAGGKRLGAFIFRQPTGPGEFIFGKADFRNIDTIKLFIGNNDALMNELDIQKKAITGNALLDTVHEAMSLNQGKRFDQLDTLIGQQSSDQIEQFIIRLMEAAESRGTYKTQTIDMSHSVFQMLEGKEFTSPLALTRERIGLLAEAGVADEKYLVEQYNYGNMTRIFATEGSFDFSDEIHEGLRAYVGADEFEDLAQKRLQYQSLMKSAVKSEVDAGIALQNEYSDTIAKIMRASDEETRAGISSLFDEDLARKGRAKVLGGDTIGSYINRLTIAAAGADQQQAILSRLEGKVDNRVLSAIRNTRIATFAPSDVVDVIANLNEGVSVESVAGLERLYGSAVDQEAAARAILKITSQISADAGVSAVEAAGRQMIQTKFELLGELRALAMQNLTEEADYKNLLSGIDNAIIGERLKRR
jgi:hypothetical protein